MQNKDWMREALEAATWSPALRGKVGIVAVRDGKEVSRACNGLPLELGREKCETEAPTIAEAHTLPEVLHAEEFLTSQAAYHGKSLKDCEVYITRTPCKHCASNLIVAGIKKLYYFGEHPHGDGLPILKEAGIPYEQVQFEQKILPKEYL